MAGRSRGWTDDGGIRLAPLWHTPPRHLYVTCASEFMVPNLAPLLAGPEPFDAVLILKGCGEPPTDNDLRAAVRPAERSRRLLAGRGMSEVHVLRVPPFDPAGCHAALAAVGPLSGTRVTCALNGGTKVMNFASVAALAGLTGSQPELVYFQPGPPRLIRGLLDGAGGAPERLPQPTLTMEEYLELHGFKVAHADRGRARREEAFVREALAQRIAALALPGDRVRPDVLAALKKLAGARTDGGDRGEGAWPGGIAARLAAIPGIGNAREDYLTGGWLEDITFLRSEARLGGIPGVRVEPNVCVKLDDPNSIELAEHEHELDVVIYHADQLHLIECKTRPFQREGGSQGYWQGVFNRLAVLKRRLVGQYGTVALLNPHPLLPANAEVQRRRAEHAGIELWTGSRALADLKARLDRLARV